MLGGSFTWVHMGPYWLMSPYKATWGHLEPTIVLSYDICPTCIAWLVDLLNYRAITSLLNKSSRILVIAIRLVRNTNRADAHCNIE